MSSFDPLITLDHQPVTASPSFATAPGSCIKEPQNATAILSNCLNIMVNSFRDAVCGMPTASTRSIDRPDNIGDVIARTRLNSNKGTKSDIEIALAKRALDRFSSCFFKLVVQRSAPVVW